MKEEQTNRSGVFVLASMISGYPGKGFLENVEILTSDAEVKKYIQESAIVSWGKLITEVERLKADPARLDDLCSEYIDTFDRGKEANPLYETEYGKQRSMVKGNQLVDISAFYNAFGFDLGSEGQEKELLDHVSVELEFYALLLMKEIHLQNAGDTEGVEIVDDARAKFLKDHLGRFISSICDRPGVGRSRFYSTVFEFCRELVAQECIRMNVSPEHAEWLAGDKEEEKMACGGAAGGCLK